MPIGGMVLKAYENGDSERQCEKVVALNAYGGNDSEGLWKWWLWMPKIVEVALNTWVGEVALNA